MTGTSELVEKLSWVAGFFDGEGTINITLSKNDTLCGQVSLSQRDARLLHQVRDILCEAGIEGSPVSKFRTSGSLYYLNYYGVRGTDFLAAIQPYLRGQKRRCRAELFTEMYPPGTFNQTRRSEKLAVYKKWLELRIRELKGEQEEQIIIKEK